MTHHLTLDRNMTEREGKEVFVQYKNGKVLRRYIKDGEHGITPYSRYMWTK